MKNILLWLGIGLCVACSTTPKDSIPVIFVDPAEAKDYYADEVIDSLMLLPLEDSTIMGDIYDIKIYDDYLFFHDYHQGKVHIFDRAGEWVNTLSKVGKGPQEYLAASLYAYNPQTKELVINSCERGLNTYSVPTLNFISNVEDRHGYTAFEWIDANHTLGLYDYNQGKLNGGGEIVNTRTGKTRSLFDADSLAIASFVQSQPSTVSMAEDGALYYCMPFTHSTVYRIDTLGAKPLFQIHFGDYALQKKVWNQDIIPYFDDEFYKGKYAISPQYLILNDSTRSFWYCCSENKRENWVHPTQCYQEDKKTGKVRNIRNVKIRDTELKLLPLGTYNGFYLSVIDPALLLENETRSQSPVTLKLLEAATAKPNATTPILVMYRLKQTNDDA